jgi:hypothetical protein
MKILNQAGFLPMGTEQAMCQAMESANPHATMVLTKQFIDSTSHLPGGLVGEGDSENGKR